MGKDAIIKAQKRGHLQRPGTADCVTGSGVRERMTPEGELVWGGWSEKRRFSHFWRCIREVKRQGEKEKERTNLTSPNFQSPVISSHCSNPLSSQWECSFQGSALRCRHTQGEHLISSRQVACTSRGSVVEI